MKKQKYKFYTDYIPQWGVKSNRPAFEEMQYPHMDFGSDEEANEYAKFVLGHNCFAVKVEE